MRLVVELDLVIKAVLTHLEPGECRLSGDLFTGRYVGNGSSPAIQSHSANDWNRSIANGGGTRVTPLENH